MSIDPRELLQKNTQNMAVFVVPSKTCAIIEISDAFKEGAW